MADTNTMEAIMGTAGMATQEAMGMEGTVTQEGTGMEERVTQAARGMGERVTREAKGMGERATQEEEDMEAPALQATLVVEAADTAEVVGVLAVAGGGAGRPGAILNCRNSIHSELLEEKSVIKRGVS